MKTNRSMITFVLFGILTLGIYPLFFWHSYVQDVNVICSGDGKNTRGIIAKILLSIITLGIYGLVWQYGMQNRLRDNASKYGAGVIQGGSTILLWSIFGVLLFGIGPLVSLHIRISSLNSLAYAYNSKMGSLHTAA